MSHIQGGLVSKHTSATCTMRAVKSTLRATPWPHGGLGCLDLMQVLCVCHCFVLQQGLLGGGCKRHNVGAGHWTQVPCEHLEGSLMLSHLSRHLHRTCSHALSCSRRKLLQCYESGSRQQQEQGARDLLSLLWSGFASDVICISSWQKRKAASFP